MSKKLTTVIDDRLYEQCELEANVCGFTLSAYLREVLIQRHGAPKGLPVTPASIIKPMNAPPVKVARHTNAIEDLLNYGPETWTCSNCDVNWTDSDTHCSNCKKPREAIDVLRKS